MRDAGVGRVLVASLHQGISDILPMRLGFYENWLNAEGLRGGTIGVAPVAAVLSFLRLEGAAYDQITTRAGEYAAEWTVQTMSSFERRAIGVAPEWLRARILLRTARRLVRHSCRAAVPCPESGAVHVARMELRDSVFCSVREPVGQPLCRFYAAAVTRLMTLFNLPLTAVVVACRGTGEAACVLTLPALGDQVNARHRGGRGVDTRHRRPCVSKSSERSLTGDSPAGARAVLVMPFENVAHASRIVWLGEAAAVLLADDLNALGVDAIGRDERREAFEELQVPRPRR